MRHEGRGGFIEQNRTGKYIQQGQRYLTEFVSG
jgi:hypothetical protein